MPDSYESMWREVRLYAPTCPSELCERFVRNRFRDIVEERLWSWAFKEAQIDIPSSYSVGTVDLTYQSNIVTGTDTVWTTDMVGRQIKVRNNMYTIMDVPDPLTLTIDRAWGQDSVTLQTYMIVKALFTVPNDFRGWYSIIDPSNNWRIWHNFNTRDIDRYDPARTSTGNPAVVAAAHYDQVSGLPRFELWPHQTTNKGFRYLYYKIHPDISREQALPYGIRGDIIVKGALADLCRWPGTPTQPNAMFNMKLAEVYELEYQQKVWEMARNDQEIYMTDLWYDSTDLPYAPLDAKFYQTHAV